MNAPRASGRGAPGRRTRILLLSGLFALFPLLAVVGPRRPAPRVAPPPGTGSARRTALDRPALDRAGRPAREPAATAPGRPIEARAPLAVAGATRAPATDPFAAPAHLSITVHEGGRPAPRASVEITVEGETGTRVLVRETDVRGALELDLAPGEARAVAWRADAAALPAFARLQAGQREEVVLALDPAWAVGGRVVDATSGQPIPGAAVAIWTFAESDTVVTATDGTFLHPRFPRAAPSQQVQVHAPGYGRAVRYLRIGDDGSWKLSAATDEDSAQRGSGTPWLELELVPARSVQGRVLDANGAPLAGARVAAEGFFRVMASVASRDGAEAVSDDTGHFVLDGLRSDIGHALVVEAPGHARRSFEVPADEPLAVELGDLALGRETALAGAVVDTDGRPLPDVLVVLTLVAPDEARSASAFDVAFRLESRERRVRTGPEGAFLFEGLEARAVQLALETDDGTRDMGEFVPLADGAFAAPCLVLEPPWMAATTSQAR